MNNINNIIPFIYFRRSIFRDSDLIVTGVSSYDGTIVLFTPEHEIKCSEKSSQFTLPKFDVSTCANKSCNITTENL